MERADRLAACELPIEPAGLLQGALAVDADKGIDPRLPRLGPGDAGLNELHGRDLPPSDEPRDCVELQLEDITRH